MKNPEPQKHAHEPAHEPEAPAPAPAPKPPAKKVKVRAKDYCIVDGYPHAAGDIFELPHEKALSLVGTGVAEELPADT